MSPAIRHFSSAILVGTRGELILQQRDDIPDIINPGLIGLFGGHRELGETAQECVIRELEEEIGIRFPPEQVHAFIFWQMAFEPAARIDAVAIFIIRDVPTASLVVTEGQPFVTDFAALPSLYERLTPSAAFALRHYMLVRGRAAASAPTMPGAKPSEHQ